MLKEGKKDRAKLLLRKKKYQVSHFQEVWIRNQFISAGLQLALGHVEKLFLYSILDNYIPTSGFIKLIFRVLDFKENYLKIIFFLGGEGLPGPSPPRG